MSSLKLIGVMCFAALVSFNGGCMRGMTYKIAMPESMTIGTMKDDATLASAEIPATRTVANR